MRKTIVSENIIEKIIEVKRKVTMTYMRIRNIASTKGKFKIKIKRECNCKCKIIQSVYARGDQLFALQKGTKIIKY